MNFKVNHTKSANAGEWQVDITGQEWKALLKKAKAILASKITVPGFRKGHAPQDVVDQHTSERQILTEAHRLAAAKAYKFALTQKDVEKPYGQPKIEVKTLNRNQYTLLIHFPLQPRFEVKKYTGFTNILKKKVAVSAADITQELKQLQNKFAMLSDKKTAAAMGDQVNIDFKGYINGTAFPNGSAKKFDLELGSKQFIAGFEDALVGVKAGEEREINIQFPADYIQPKIAGAKAVFEVKVNKVQAKQLPPVNAELVKDANLPNVKTVAELKKYIHDSLLGERQKNHRNDFIGELLQAIAAKAHLVIPEELVHREIKDLKRQLEKEVIQKKLTMKEYKKRSGYTDTQIEAELREDAVQRIENTIIIDHVRRAEKLVPSKQQIADEYSKLSKQFNMPVKDLQGLIKESNLVQQLSNQLVLDFLYDHNGQDAVKPSKSKAKQPAAKQTNAAKARKQGAAPKKQAPTKSPKPKASTKTK